MKLKAQGAVALPPRGGACAGLQRVRSRRSWPHGYGASTLILVVALLITGLVQSESPRASAAPGPTDEWQKFVQPGPFTVQHTAKLGTCGGMYGSFQVMDARRQGAVDPLTCNQAFPYGDAAPVGVDMYFPKDSTPTKHPVVVLVPGASGNGGYFSHTAELWASHGFVTIISYDFVSASIENHLLGIGAAIAVNGDPTSPLYHRIDTQRIVVAGHSAGGGGADSMAAIAPSVANATHGTVNIVGALLIQAFIVPPLAAVPVVPTLVLTGEMDKTAPPDGPGRTAVYNRMSAPAWFAIAKDAQHLSSVNGVDHNPFSAAQLAWLIYVTSSTNHDYLRACQVFVGDSWALPRAPELTGVTRNRAAQHRFCSEAAG